MNLDERRSLLASASEREAYYKELGRLIRKELGEKD
jgi:hypothetical protein